MAKATYRGRKVTLNKPFRLPTGSSKKSGVYVRNNKTGNVNKVTFGDPNMRIRKIIQRQEKVILQEVVALKQKDKKLSVRITGVGGLGNNGKNTNI